MSVESKLNNLSCDLHDMPCNMRLFSLSMRSLYAENAVGGSTDAVSEIKELRDETKRDALVYVKGVLPLSTEVVRSIKEFFEYYEELDLQEWKDNLLDILEEVRGYRQCCAEIIQLHEKILISLKQRQDRAKVLMSELKDLTKELEKKKQELEKSASTKKGWAVALCFIPGVNAIATPLLSMSADDDMAKAVAEGAQRDINNRVILVVSETLIPALSAFIDGLSAIAGFFSAIEQELATFQSKGEKAKENAKTLHYTMMKKKAGEIKGSCREFYVMIPGVRTDLMCIPEVTDDKNYVDRWLIQQQEEIKKKYAKGLTGQLRKMISILSTEGGGQLMLEEKK